MVQNTAEKVILAKAISGDVDEQQQIFGSIKVDDFQDSKNALLYSIIMEMNLNSDTSSIDKNSVKAYIEKSNQSLAISPDYVDEILEDVFEVSDVDYYIGLLKDTSCIKSLRDCCADLVEKINNGEVKDVTSFISNAEARILDVTNKRRSTEVRTMREAANDLLSTLIAQTKKRSQGQTLNNVTGLNTGYDYLDKLSLGWHEGDMIVIGARPSVGKTAFAINLLYNVAITGKPVLFFSLEMSAASIALRLLQKESGLSNKQILKYDFAEGSTPERIIVKRNPQALSFEDDEKEEIDDDTAIARLSKAFNVLSNLPFYIEATPGLRFAQISTKAKRLKDTYNDLALIAIDYIGLISSDEDKNLNRTQAVAKIAHGIKRLARELNIPIIALSQLSRESDRRENATHEPQMSDLRESGDIEQDADMVILLYRPDYYKKTEEGDENTKPNPISYVTAKFVKNRNGSVGDVYFYFDKPHCQFNDKKDIEDK